MELLRTTLVKFPLFTCAPETFLAQLAQAHRWIEALAGDLVVEEGQIQQEMVFVVRGKLTVLKPSVAGGVDEVQLDAGSWFGEQSFFTKRPIIRNFTAMAVEEAELAILTMMEFLKLMEIYPQMKRRLKKLAKAVQQGQLRVDDLTHSPGMQLRTLKSTTRAFRCMSWISAS
eukprot:TRINITY_DN67184_c0_g1_i1.p1 TRINITY_DN67184_c0_g1~~TRINITY_DN67184_c0_g1_i1.p1  ORF type:complete len:172 (+),score=29.39 TRINITY_DN67184_c0_g1_i1:352-867(+)